MTCTWCRRDEEDCRVLVRSAVDPTKAICDRCVADVKFILEHDEPEPPPQVPTSVARARRVVDLADVFRRRAEAA